MSEFTISGIEIVPYPTGVVVFPPDGDIGEWTEDFRNITETYRPLTIGAWPFLVYQGYVNIPGTFGLWAAHFFSTQYVTNPCDPHVLVENGVATVHSCHHEYFDDGQGYARIQLEDLSMNMPEFWMTSITWDVEHNATGDDVTDALSIGISDYGRWDCPGGVSAATLNMDPIRKLITVGDGTMWPDFAFKARVTWDAAPQEVNEFDLIINELTISNMPPDEKDSNNQRYTYDGYLIPEYLLKESKTTAESLK